MLTTDSSLVIAAKRLLDTARDSGFHFERIAEGPDAPLIGVRECVDWRDEIYLARFADTQARYSILLLEAARR